MKQHYEDIILNSTGASALHELETIQELWSGYGHIIRFGLEGTRDKTVVVKHVRIPTKKDHPRGWNTDYSHQRKIHSYEVETAWYREYSSRCTDRCRVPRCYAVEYLDGEIFMVLEDLDQAGFGKRRRSVNWAGMQDCLSWLAIFHAVFMGMEPAGLWEIGTYWHLKTRPDELKVLDDAPLRRAAAAIDAKLNNTAFPCFVHGDAKLANFCYSQDGQKAAAVDFQYVGGGCGMKDVAYFTGSCLHESAFEQMEEQILRFCFNELKQALTVHHPDIEADAVEADWRDLPGRRLEPQRGLLPGGPPHPHRPRLPFPHARLPGWLPARV